MDIVILEGKKHQTEAQQVLSKQLAGKCATWTKCWCSGRRGLCAVLPGSEGQQLGAGVERGRGLGRLWGIATAIQVSSLEGGKISRGFPEPAFPKCITGDCPDVL